MYFTDDPIADYNRWSREQEEQLKKLPKCHVCGEPIQDDYAVCIDDNWYCDNCISDMRKYTGV